MSHVQPTALHVFSAIISDKKGSFIFSRLFLPPSLSSQRPILLSFESERAPRSLCLQSFDSVHDRFTLGQVFSLQKQNIHCRLAPPFFCISLSMVRICFCRSPPGLVRTLNPFLQAVLRPSGLIENMSLDMNFFSNGSLCGPVVVLISMLSIISSA